MGSDGWPRVILNTVKAASADPRRALSACGQRPRKSLSDTQGTPVVWAALAPVALNGLGVHVILGGLGTGALAWLVGVALIAAGLFSLYLNVVYLRRPVSGGTSQPGTPRRDASAT